jgi:hypothetical protein
MNYLKENWGAILVAVIVVACYAAMAIILCEYAPGGAAAALFFIVGVFFLWTSSLDAALSKLRLETAVLRMRLENLEAKLEGQERTETDA